MVKDLSHRIYNNGKYPETIFSLSVFLSYFFSCFLFFLFALLFSFCGLCHWIDARTHVCTYAQMQARVNHFTNYREDGNTVSVSLYRFTLLSVPFSQDVEGFWSKEIHRSNPEVCENCVREFKLSKMDKKCGKIEFYFRRLSFKF